MTDILFSLGYRCSSAGIIKRLQEKRESYPFDWLVSRLPIVEDCCRTEFAHFLDKCEYEHRHTNTHHYTTTSPDSANWICSESIYWNRYYQNYEDAKERLYIPLPVDKSRDAYGFNLMMNHRNILSDTDHEYYVRCVERWNTMRTDPCKKTSLYIHPTMQISPFNEMRQELIEEIERFHGMFRSKMEGKYKGLYVLPVRTEYRYPITAHIAEPIETVLEREDIHIVILWANCEFIDAGEIFMGNMWIETDRLCEWVSRNK